MKLQTKLFLAIVLPLVVTVVGTAFFSARATTDALQFQMERDGVTIAQLLTRSSSFAMRVPERVEDVVGNQMAVQALTTSHLIGIAESRAHMSPDEITAILKDIVGHTTLDEFFITDETGKVYLTNTGIDFTFKPSASEQPQAFIFYSLLGQKYGTMIQGAQRREIDSGVYKYVGVSGIDKPRIVQVGYRASILDELSRDVNAQKLVDDLTGQGNVASLRLIGADGKDLARSANPLRGIGLKPSDGDLVLMADAFKDGAVHSSNGSDSLRIAVPLVDETEQVQMVALVYLLTDSVQAAVHDGIVRSLIMSGVVILLGIVISYLLSNSIIRPILALTGAARALEHGEQFEPAGIQDVASSGDELALLARVFIRMAEEVQARMERLKDQVRQLRIEIDDTKKVKQVQEITETDYFQTLRQRAREMRESAAD